MIRIEQEPTQSIDRLHLILDALAVHFRGQIIDKMDAFARFGFPKRDNYSISYWLQSVQGDPLLDHRTTPELPPSSDIVVIGSGVSNSQISLTKIAG